MPSDQSLPPLAPVDPLGRGVFSSKQAKRWRNGRKIHESFLGGHAEQTLSVDRLDHASDEAMTAIADDVARGRGPGRDFYGWAVVSVGHAEGMGRIVHASPLPSNRYHADIDLHLADETEIRDAQKQHAEDLAMHATWRERRDPQ